MHENNTKKTERFLILDEEQVLKILADIEAMKKLMEQKFSPYPLPQRWLTPKQVCELLNMSRRKLDYLNKKLKKTSIDSKKYYKASDIEKMLEENYK